MRVVSSCRPASGSTPRCMIVPVFERFSVPARQAIVRARDESMRLNDGLELDSGHLLVGLAGREGDQAQQALSAVSITPTTLHLALVDARGREAGRLGHFGPDLRRVFEAAIARRALPDEVTTADLLMAIIDSPDCVGHNALVEIGVDLNAARAAASDALSGDDPDWIPNPSGVWIITVGSDNPDAAGKPRDE